MKSERLTDRLALLRQEIAALRVVKCRMSHERVKRSGDSMLPVRSRLPGLSYERIGLCSPEVRAEMLACSHTTARIKLKNAIDELSAATGKTADQVRHFADELNQLNNQIHLLDHRKGEAELLLAEAEEEVFRLGTRDAKNKLNKAKQSVSEMELLHDSYVDQIGILRDRVVSEFDIHITNGTGGLR